VPNFGILKKNNIDWNGNFGQLEERVSALERHSINSNPPGMQEISQNNKKFFETADFNFKIEPVKEEMPPRFSAPLIVSRNSST